MKINDDGLGLILDASFGDELRAHWLELDASDTDYSTRVKLLAVFTAIILAGESKAILSNKKRIITELMPFIDDNRDLIVTVLGRALKELPSPIDWESVIKHRETFPH